MFLSYNLVMDRVILHCDMNNFYASVELLEHPELKDLPVAISGSQEARHGIILAKNQIAKSYGVVTAETIWHAKRKCPELILLPPHHEKYSHFSKKINEIYLRYTDLVEPFSIDESWLDVTGSRRLFGSGKEIADSIRETVYRELGLTLSAGVSFNKIFAKMGSEYKKPFATTEISRENYKEILWPMAARELFFVGRATAEKLNSLGIYTIGDIANSREDALYTALGKHGIQLFKYANGLDDSPVCKFGEREPIKSIGNGWTLPHNLTERDEVLSAVTSLSETVAARLRKHQLKAFGIKVDIKDPSFVTISRQKQLDNPTNLTLTIKKAAIELIEAQWGLKDTCRPIRLITITGINLVPEDEEFQFSFFHSDKDEKSNETMERTMDQIRKKFGKNSISFGKSSLR